MYKNKNKIISNSNKENIEPKRNETSENLKEIFSFNANNNFNNIKNKSINFMIDNPKTRNSLKREFFNTELINQDQNYKTLKAETTTLNTSSNENEAILEETPLLGDNLDHSVLAKSIIGYKEKTPAHKTNCNESLRSNEQYSQNFIFDYTKNSDLNKKNLNTVENEHKAKKFLDESIYIAGVKIQRNDFVNNDKKEFNKSYNENLYENAFKKYGNVTIFTGPKNLDLAKSMLDNFNNTFHVEKQKVFERKCKHGFNVLYKENEVKPKYSYNYFDN